MPPTDSEGDRHVPALDGLRGVAILLVLFFHFTMFGRLALVARRVPIGVERAVGSFIATTAMSAWIGVDLFFVLSGYLITTILLEDKGRPRFFRRFYARRAARILPLYYGLLAVYALFLVVSSADDKLRSLVWPASFTTNVALGLFGDGAIPHEIQFLWSLAIEEQFYLVFPLVVAVLPRGILRVVCVLGVVVALVFRAVIRPELALASFLTPARFDGLLVGAFVAAVLQPLAREPAPAARTRARWALLLTSVALGVFVAWRGGLQGADLIVDIYGRTPLNVFFGAVVASLVLLRGSLLARLLSVAPLRFFGRYSYAMYMLHVPLLAGILSLHLDIVRFTIATRSLLAGYGLFLAIATGATVVAALGSHVMVERPFMALRQRLR
jgi:peptidoglycan/LPS O-acetylase OafA/YrhL